MVSTLDVTLVDENNTSNRAKVESDGSLNVNTTPTSGTIQEIRIRDGNGTALAHVLSLDVNRLAVQTIEDAQGAVGTLFQKNSINTFTVNETQDVISFLVPSGQKIFVRMFQVSGDREGAVNSKYQLINKVNDTTETVQDVFFADLTFRTEYPRGVEFAANDRIIVRIINAVGANANHTATLNG